MRHITRILGSLIIGTTCIVHLSAAQLPPSGSQEGTSIDSPAQAFRTSDQNYFLVPSTRTLPAGEVSLSNINVMMFNLDVGLGSTTQFSMYGTVPTTNWNESHFMYGIKQNLWNGQQTSAAVLLLDAPTERYLVGGAVISYGDRTNIAIGPVMTVDYAGNVEPSAFIGFKIDPAEHLAFMVDAILPTASAGLRWYGEHIALDLGGYYYIDTIGRSIQNNRTFVPFVKVQYLF